MLILGFTMECKLRVHSLIPIMKEGMGVLEYDQNELLNQIHGHVKLFKLRGKGNYYTLGPKWCIDK
jgi:hypothetical protein